MGPSSQRQTLELVGLPPLFHKTEHYHDPNADPLIHGLNGPIQTATPTSSGRHHPLREPVKAAWKELGLKEISDLNAGDQLGVAEAIEARTNSKRVDITTAYPGRERRRTRR